ncbi:MAG: hypothetical protein IKF78_10145 [Atopobiaceae bacterium]|nr:hypothetical protein [Atopobiaceae bacterium]
MPYQAHTSFDGESKVVSSQVKSVKFRVSAAKGSSTKSSLAKTGDTVPHAVSGATALVGLAAAVLSLAARKHT